MEPHKNIRFICQKCGLHPDPVYASMPPVSFIGKFCKVAFPCPDGRNEYMWVEVFGFAESTDQELRGRLNNEPLFADVKNGDVIEFNRAEIIAIL